MALHLTRIIRDVVIFSLQLCPLENLYTQLKTFKIVIGEATKIDDAF